MKYYNESHQHLMISCEEMSPSEGKNRGIELIIEYGVIDTPFGKCFIAATNQGICKLAFFDAELEKKFVSSEIPVGEEHSREFLKKQKSIEKELHDEWKHACIINNEAKIKSLAAMIFTSKKDEKKPGIPAKKRGHSLNVDMLRKSKAFACTKGEEPRFSPFGNPHRVKLAGTAEKKPLKLVLKGSPFQLKVWKALLSIPETCLVAYQDVAIAIENPKAVRAVASAIAQNNIAYLVPCHRVIRRNGDFGQYRWDKYRKQALIAWEANPPPCVK